MPGPMNVKSDMRKAKNFKKAWMNLYKFAKPYLWPFLIALFFAIAGSVLVIIGPQKLSQISDIITESFKNGFEPFNMGKIESICFFLVAIYCFSTVLSYLQGFITNTINQKLSKRFRSEIASKINRLPLSYMDKTTYGDILSRVTNDVDLIGQSLSQSTTQMVSSLTQFFGALVMMFITNYIMAFSAIITTFVGIVIVIFIIKHSQKYFLKQQIGLGQLNGHVEEIYSGHNVVKAYNAENNSIDKFNKINNDLFNSAWKSQFFSGLMQPIMQFVGNFGYVVVCVVGSVLTIKGITSFGVVVAFIVYIRLFTQPLAQIAQATTSLQQTAAASERVFDFLNQEEMENEEHKNEAIKKVVGNVLFKNVKFGYDKDREIIHNFSCDIKAGQKVAIVGPTGAGKTTLVNLLMRFYEPWSGSIFVDGMDISKLKREQVHDMFAMVLQDSWTFEGSIYDNIVYSKTNVSRKAVIKASKLVGLHHFIQTLPDGYDTILDENTNISQGQRQLLTIARAMVKNAPMLILDEATSSVDTRTEIIIQKAMDKLTANRTSFVIAHRLSTIKNADVILVLQNGDVVEQGNHLELLAQNGVYASLYNSQFEQE